MTILHARGQWGDQSSGDQERERVKEAGRQQLVLLGMVSFQISANIKVVMSSK